jgi:tetratricopeptide (TPR) repeat protein
MFSWFNVADDIKQLLILVADNWQDTSKSQYYINQALSQTNNSVDVLVAAYRYFYYKNNYQMALSTASQVINNIKDSENLPDNWEQLQQVLSNRKEDSQIRLYLNAYAASGLVLAKLGDIEQAKTICVRIKEIDVNNEFAGASILFDILTRPPEEND